MSTAAALRDEITEYEAILAALDELDVVNELAVADDDDDLASETESSLKELTRRVDDIELSSWFTGEFDHGDAIVTIIPGQGGLEAQDWAEMLLKMITKYAQSRKWKVDGRTRLLPGWRSESTAPSSRSTVATPTGCSLPRRACIDSWRISPHR